MAVDTASRGRTTGSRLFRHIEDLQGDMPWGSFLDAGTGTHSIRWVASLNTQRWTAVTGAEGHAIQVRDAVEQHRRPQDRIVLGNWSDETMLAGEQYDTVLADYLVGAIEGVAPYFQPYLFSRLRRLTGRRLYVVGLEPYVAVEPDTPAGKMVWEIGRFRDACLTLAGERPYREYPSQWVVDHLEVAGFCVREARRFPIRYKERFVHSQIDMCASRLARLEDRGLTATLKGHGENLRTRAVALINAEGGLNHGFDYILRAEPQ